MLSSKLEPNPGSPKNGNKGEKCPGKTGSSLENKANRPIFGMEYNQWVCEQEESNEVNFAG